MLKKDVLARKLCMKTFEIIGLKHDLKADLVHIIMTRVKRK